MKGELGNAQKKKNERKSSKYRNILFRETGIEGSDVATEVRLICFIAYVILFIFFTTYCCFLSNVK